MPDIADRSPTFFRQIATGVALLLALFTLVNGVLVIGLYARDPDQLARDVVRSQAQRIVGDLEAGRAPAMPESMRRWRWTAEQPAGRLVGSGGEAPGDLDHAPGGDWTSLTLRRDDGPLIAGSTRIDRGGREYRVALTLDAASDQVLRSALALELWEHVLLPLSPLVLLSLLATMMLARRLSQPVRAMADAADRLDPGRLSARLTPPPSPQELRRLVLALNRALDRIESASRMMREFNANAAHELRTPLAVMTLAIDELPASDATNRLRHDVSAMSRTVAQMLDLAQAESIASLPKEPVSLRQVAADVVALIAPLAWKNGREVGLAAGEDAVVAGNREIIARALRNLVENGLRHTPKGGAVELSVGPGPKVAVRDHGPGIPAGVEESLFLRFWREDRSNGDSAGLGLAIVKAAMDAHGGHVRVFNAPDGGAVFELAFPDSQTPE